MSNTETTAIRTTSPTAATGAVERSAVKTVTGHRTTEGDGFVVRRPFPGPALDLFDPFLLLDEMGPTMVEPGKGVGTPDHPHRGFETVTYLIDGELEHRDSLGNGGLLGAGDTQWMTAGAGIIHKEGPSARLQKSGGRSHGFQLWVNLPAALKMTPPRYQDIRADAVAVADLVGGGRARVIAGTLFGVDGPGSTLTPISYAHVSIPAGTSASTQVPAEHNVGVLVFGGSAEVGGVTAADGQFVILGEGTVVTLRAHTDTELLVLVGQPLNEPVARYGPFVMNTRAELAQAFEDYQSGRMGSIPAVTL